MPRPRHQRPSSLKKFLFGCPYYPEHWTAKERKNDAERMQSAGVNVVRLAEFAWDRIEPSRGHFDFSLFDETIAQLGDYGIDTILCTPTAAPPRWLTEGDQWMRIDVDGRAMKHGSRQHCCTNHPGFRAESDRITQAMARHFASNARVVGWQTDNELFCHISKCYCPACRERFQNWLAQKYQTIHNLNAEWGTAFWAQTYDRFDHVDFPFPARPTYSNPSQVLDHCRFLSDSLTDFQTTQVAILRSAQPNWWITHNGIFRHVDNWKFSEALDFFAVDVYPSFWITETRLFAGASVLNERCRAASGSYIIPEQQGGAGGQGTWFHATPAPGQMRLWAYQSIAHGADGILHFRWRTCRFGAESYWNGILDHDDIPRRRYAEFAQEGGELQRIGGAILGTTMAVKAAVLIETDQEEAFQSLTLGLPGPLDQANVIYEEMLARHLPAGLVEAADSLDGLTLLVMPSFLLMDDALAARLRAFVEQGGVLVATARTATRLRNNHVTALTPPGALAGLFGVTVEEFGVITPNKIAMEIPGAPPIAPHGGYEVLGLHGAQPLATWGERTDQAPSAATGQTAISIHRVGRGSAIYIGSWFSEKNLDPLFSLILAETDVKPIAVAARSVEITRRDGKGRHLIFLLNHGGQPATVTNLPTGNELLSQKPCLGEWSLPAYGVGVIEWNPQTVAS